MDKTVVKEKKTRCIPTKKLVYTAMMTAIMAVLSQVAFPLPSGVPLTLQTFAVSLCGYFGGIWGVVAVVIYLALGAVGVPVFANFKGGFAAIAGVTGGFLVGFIFLALTCAIKLKFKNEILNSVLRILLGCVGVLICHLLGILWYAYQSGNGYVASFLTVSAPYLLKDFVSVVLAYIFTALLNKRTKLAL